MYNNRNLLVNVKDSGKKIFNDYDKIFEKNSLNNILIMKFLLRNKKILRIKIIIKSFKFAFKFILSSINPNIKQKIAEIKKIFESPLFENSINSKPNKIFANKKNNKLIKKNRPPDKSTLPV